LIKQLFEKKLKKESLGFRFWVRDNVCSLEEFNNFSNWLNQLSEKQLLKYIQKDPSILKVIKNQTESICQTAIEKAPTCIRFLNNQTEFLCELAINKSPWTFEYVRNQTDYLCRLAIEKDPYNIALIKEQTIDLCILALQKRRNACNYIRIVPNPNYETTLKNLLEKKAILEALK